MESAYVAAAQASDSVGAVCKAARIAWELNKTPAALVTWFDAADAYYYAAKGAVEAATKADMGETIIRMMIDLRGEAFDQMASVISILKAYIDAPAQSDGAEVELGVSAEVTDEDPQPE
jgi:hypothetical protein